MNEIGFVGLGRMGQPIVDHLRENFRVSAVYNRTAEKIPPDLKNVAKSSPLEVAENSDIIFLIVTDSAASWDVVSNIIEGSVKGKLIVDMSTISFRQSLKNHDAVLKSGNNYMDCPVIGSVPAAVSGKLTSVAGGRMEDFSRVREMLKTFTGKQIYAGKAGSGIALKLSNNHVMGSAMASLAEAIAMSRSKGISLETIIEAFQSGGAMTRILDLKRDKISREDFSPEFSLRHQLKDLRYAMELAEEMGVVHSVLSSVEAEYSISMSKDQDPDMSYIVHFVKKLGLADE
ncbi:NAD(P)-dependent oxidoreductase [Cuniculiplasma sp. SKW3]|uniref:NAD(P)-dependent oxidoreductase n=1 Tax=Cuniculiplasma sp. SKW3 TaxID=3400170 RepID=UPI003FD40A45